MAEKRKDLLCQELEVLKDISHLTIEYEKDLLKEENHQKTADKIFQYLGLSSVQIDTSLSRTGKDNLDEVIENYVEFKNVIGKSEFAAYLD